MRNPAIERRRDLIVIVIFVAWLALLAGIEIGRRAERSENRESYYAAAGMRP